MSARVEKQWKEKGLAGYPTEAILGTLGHYGVQLDEASFKAAAADRFPLELAVDWKPKWKGTGQFAPFPYAAANELFNRLLPQQATPMKTAQVVLELIAHALKREAGHDDASLQEAFQHWDELVPQLPPDGDRRDTFLRELVGFLESWTETFNELPERLAKAGKREEAMRFALVHEVLFTSRQGCMSALVRAHCGEREAAVADLKAWAQEASRDVFARHPPSMGSYQLEEFEAAKVLGLGVFDEPRSRKWGLADSSPTCWGTWCRKSVAMASSGPRCAAGWSEPMPIRVGITESSAHALRSSWERICR